ncbi:MAG: SpoIIE family protein phosphatase [Spirochaetes bacterium]|nr:SpoIIE family protein phosphatase [Spirochaetota bacterium]
MNRISIKLALTVLVVAVVAAIPLSMYILLKQEKEKIESTVAIGRGNTKLLGKTMLDVFLKSGGEPNSMRIDAEEAMNTYKDQFDLGLVFGQTLMLSKKHRGLIMATIDKNGLEKPKKPDANKDKQAEITRKEDEINNFLKYEESHSGPCFNNPAEKCYNFSFVAKYEKTPVILSVMSISEKHVLDPIKRLRFLIYISAGVAVVLALMLGVGVSRFITGPITALVEGVHRYTKGDLDYKVDIRVKDELKTLGTAFNDMADQIATKIREIEDHRDNLEVKVQERTSELRTALTEVSKLKEQQDADYYLTTFLFKPLCINRNSSEYISTEFFLKQKKEFSFRDKKGEIGGDICITANLLFRESDGTVNRYLFATNADAMGKSIQGAGGAIVYGTAINTIIASSTANNRVLETSPREWLMRMYRELHNIFLSFDGSMLVSGVFMLLNEHNGNAYYINAEHPWTILFRDNKSEFIEQDLMLRKLGADIPGHTLTVKEFSFKVGDVLFLASDGRDDIVLKEAENGQNRVINEDEKAILDIILQGSGSLQKTVETLQNTGGFSDDLSIIRIEVLGFNPQPIERQRIAENARASVKERLSHIKLLIQKKDFAGAATALQETSSELNIENVPQYYILLSRIQLNDGQLQLARESLEKALRLGHEAAPTYKSLGNIFYKLKMKKEAVEAWEKAMLLNPEDKSLRNLLDELQAQAV